MAGSSGRAGAPKAEARTLGWPAILAILALAAVVRGLRIWSVLRWSEDDTLDAIPAIQILRGTFPLFHVAVEYGGTAKSFVLALWFALAGISTAALDAFGYLVGLAGVWTSILLARRILPPGAALFAGLGAPGNAWRRASGFRWISARRRTCPASPASRESPCASPTAASRRREPGSGAGRQDRGRTRSRWCARSPR